LEEIKNKDREKKFNLRDVPCRLTLCKTADTGFHMILSYHHILLDGWSMGIILKEFFTAYETFSHGKPLPEGNKTPFKQFVQWNQNRDADGEKNFWTHYFEGFEMGGGFSINSNKSATGLREMASCQTCLEPDETDRLDGFISRSKVTWAALLYLGWGLLLQKYSNHNDVLFGTTVSGRSAKIPGIENMVGLFINALPLRVCCQRGETIPGILRDINHTLRAREAYELTPMVNINRYSRGSLGEEPFDSLVVVENYPLDIQRIQESGSLTIDSSSMEETTHYNLTVTIQMFDSIQIHFSYRR
ncbi:MAG: hypothetical protein GY940_37890, partial [bacterium]|nr:hypothetical protein [bacterium]